MIAHMRTSRLGTAVLVLSALLALTYLAGAVLGGLLFDWDDDGGDNDRLFWILFLIAGSVLLLAGLFLADRSRWLAAVLISVGAVVGAIVIFWSIVIPLAAIVLIVLAVLWARSPRAATA
jgi:hypothetical protein